MRLRVLIIPDKFKGTLGAPEAARAVAAGWRRARPQDRIRLLPMSDGGDGFGEALSGLLGGRLWMARTVDAAHRPCQAPWWLCGGNRLAVVESARVIGLAMLPAGRFHPAQLDTFGLGRLLRAARDRGSRGCLIGIGGSATNDGGFGLARALGWEFTDARGGRIEAWTGLRALHRVRPPTRPPLAPMTITVAVDVTNPLLGPQGATRIYGPQKGLRPADFPWAEACLRRLATVTGQHLGRDFAALPGSGAAGGLGFGLMAFARAGVEPGFRLFARHSGLGGLLRGTDLVLTGEGALDRSTLMGKGVGELARWCRRRGIPCLGLAGVANDRRALRRVLTGVAALAPDLTTAERARSETVHWLTLLAEHTGRRWERIEKMVSSRR